MKQNQRHHYLILDNAGKRLSKIEKFLMREHGFDKDTDSGIFPRDDR